MDTEKDSNLTDLRSAVIAFRDARDWQQYHNAKDVAISLTLEAAELLEIFQWSESPPGRDFIESKRPQIEDEIADVLYWVLLLSHDLDVDLANALRQKLAANELKYPVSLSRGKSSKYKDLAP